MAKYGKTSEARLSSITSSAIKAVFRRVVKFFDNTIPEYGGLRTSKEQAQLVGMGRSKTLHSKHLDGKAIDAIPYPVMWPTELPKTGEVSVDIARKYAKALARYYYFGGYVLGTADCMGVRLRWGGDWDGDRDINDQSFDDLVHFEERD